MQCGRLKSCGFYEGGIYLDTPYRLVVRAFTVYELTRWHGVCKDTVMELWMVQGD